jgi:hypothetical protein
MTAICSTLSVTDFALPARPGLAASATSTTTIRSVIPRPPDSRCPTIRISAVSAWKMTVPRRNTAMGPGRRSTALPAGPSCRAERPRTEPHSQQVLGDLQPGGARGNPERRRSQRGIAPRRRTSGRPSLPVTGAPAAQSSPAAPLPPPAATAVLAEAAGAREPARTIGTKLRTLRRGCRDGNRHRGRVPARLGRRRQRSWHPSGTPARSAINMLIDASAGPTCPAPAAIARPRSFRDRRPFAAHVVLALGYAERALSPARASRPEPSLVKPPA